MIFRLKSILLEKPTQRDIWFDKNTPSKDSDVIDWVNNKSKNPSLQNLIAEDTEESRQVLRAIRSTIFVHGFQEASNDFLKFAKKFDFSRITVKAHFKNIETLAQLYIGSDAINLTRKHIFNDTLYERSARDFEYTVKLLNILTDSALVKKYYRDPSVVDLTQIYDGQGIKPAGIGDFSTKTLYGTVEAWSSAEGKAPTKGGSQSRERIYSSLDEVEEEKKITGEVVKAVGKFRFNPNIKNWEHVTSEK